MTHNKLILTYFNKFYEETYQKSLYINLKIDNYHYDKLCKKKSKKIEKKF